MTAHSVSRIRKVGAGVWAGCFLAYLIALSPHLVHHVTDADDAPQCVYLALAEHAPVAVAAAPLLIGILPVTSLAQVVEPARPDPPPAFTALSRAPPHTPRARS